MLQAGTCAAADRRHDGVPGHRLERDRWRSQASSKPVDDIALASSSPPATSWNSENAARLRRGCGRLALWRRAHGIRVRARRGHKRAAMHPVAAAAWPRVARSRDRRRRLLRASCTSQCGRVGQRVGAIDRPCVAAGRSDESTAARGHSRRRRAHRCRARPGWCCTDRRRVAKPDVPAAAAVNTSRVCGNGRARLRRRAGFPRRRRRRHRGPRGRTPRRCGWRRCDRPPDSSAGWSRGLSSRRRTRARRPASSCAAMQGKTASPRAAYSSAASRRALMTQSSGSEARGFRKATAH